MTIEESFEKALKSFSEYYDVSTDDVPEPFSALCEFKSHSEQYFLVKAAKISDIDSNDFVYIYKAAENEKITAEILDGLQKSAWEKGLSKIAPKYGHRNSDVTLIVLAADFEKSALKDVKKLHHYKSYGLGLKGWSQFRVLAYKAGSGEAVSNWFGRSLKKIFA